MKKYTIIAIATAALLVAGTAKTIANEQPAIETEQQDDRVYDICEQLPNFPGGEAKLMEFLMKNVKYPKQAEECGAQGRVIVQFIVEKDGSITKPKVVKFSQDANDPQLVVTRATVSEKDYKTGIQALKDEAVRVVKAMPKWTPGKQRGKVVRVKYSIPVTYRLS